MNKDLTKNNYVATLVHILTSLLICPTNTNTIVRKKRFNTHLSGSSFRSFDMHKLEHNADLRIQEQTKNSIIFNRFGRLTEYHLISFQRLPQSSIILIFIYLIYHYLPSRSIQRLRVGNSSISQDEIEPFGFDILKSPDYQTEVDRIFLLCTHSDHWETDDLILRNDPLIHHRRIKLP